MLNALPIPESTLQNACSVFHVVHHIFVFCGAESARLEQNGVRCLYLTYIVKETCDLQFLQKADRKTGAAPDPAVSKLREWRNNLVAHRDYDLSLGGIAEFLRQFPGQFEGIEWSGHDGAGNEFPLYPVVLSSFALGGSSSGRPCRPRWSFRRH
jgi:hypothetical protein